LGHTAVFTCAILIAAGLFRTPAAMPSGDYAERILADAHGFAEQPATSRTIRTETAGPNRSGGLATFFPHHSGAVYILTVLSGTQ
jgi:hypothetical protein